ncbi:hypothetical protein AYR46_08410 [Sphingobium yanoikuyae]|nr:hypothetical protein AYR46_08410 [Sphingobium yanoikuyae]
MISSHQCMPARLNRKGCQPLQLIADPHGPIAIAPKQERLGLHLFMLVSQDMALIWTVMVTVLVASLIGGVSQNNRSPRKMPIYANRPWIDGIAKSSETHNASGAIGAL